MKNRWPQLIALLSASLCSCSSSILTDVPQPYSYLPSHTSFEELTQKYRGHEMEFGFRGDSSADGILTSVGRDSVRWLDLDSLQHASPTTNLTYIKHSSNTVPCIVGAALGGVALGYRLGTVTSGGGMEGPEPINPVQVAGFTAAGAILGLIAGNFVHITATYEIDHLTFESYSDSSSNQRSIGKR